MKIDIDVATDREIADREKQKKERREQRQNRCADYPGLAFGSAAFGSETMMK